jgi:IclR family transcriptional regulator, acetate operon repressor
MAVKPLHSLQRALAVLEAVAAEQPIGVGALARRLGEDKSTLQRVLVTLHATGWIRPAAGESTRWEVTTRPLVVAHLAQQRSNDLGRARPVMEALREATGESVVLAVPDTGRIVTVDVAESRQLIRSAPHLGMVLPIDAGAAALAIFAHLTPAEIASFGAPIGDPNFDAELRHARARGWSLNAGVISAHTTSIGAAVLDATGRPVAAMVVSAPSARLTADLYDAVGQQVLTAARAASA